MQNLFNTCTCRDADGPQETAGDVGLLALSRCLQVKFTKLKWPVCFSLIEELCWVLWDVSREDAGMTEHCRKSFAPGSVYEGHVCVLHCGQKNLGMMCHCKYSAVSKGNVTMV